MDEGVLRGRRVRGKTPNSKASRRTVKLLPSVVTLLKRHPFPANDGLVFTRAGSDQPIARTCFNRRVLKPAAKRGAIHHLPSAHDL